MKLNPCYSVLPVVLLAACGVAAGNPDRPQKLHIDKRYPPAATSGTPLTLQGRNFGDRTGKVAIAGKSVKVLSWSDDKVVVETPSHATTACDSARVVSVEGDVSNAVPFSYGDRGVWLPNSEEPSARQFALSVWTGDEMFVWGGGSSGGGRYNPRTDNWLPVMSDGGPQAADVFSASYGIWTGKEILIWTGFGGARYAPDTDTWRPMQPKGVPKTEGGSSAVWTGKEMIVWGAYGGARYDPETDRWHAISAMVKGNAELTATLKRAFHTAVWTGDAMIIWGGQLYDQRSIPVNTGAIYHPDEDRWEALPEPKDFAPRSFHLAAWTGKEMLVWGGTRAAIPNGIPGSRDELSGARFDLQAQTWKTMSAPGMPTGSVGATGVWTGTEWIVFGGRSVGIDTLPHAGGAIYDPTSDTWRALVTEEQPMARANAAALWTGEEMLVWGGLGPDLAPISSGGRYDPQRERWSPMNGVRGGPTPRAGHTYLWTGAEMIVWGGFQDIGYGYHFAIASQGSRYNPVTNEWLPMNEPTAPRGRVWHTSVWTGSQMIVAGGIEARKGEADGGAFQDFGEQATTPVAYRPATGEWTALSTVGAPQGTQQSSAVWTGDEMIIWGGGTRGAAYAPLTDTWTALDQTDAPPSRRNANMVWTGREVIVYGGGGDPMPSQNKNVNSGGVYNPSTQKWRAIPSAEFLDVGANSSAIWSGSEFVLVGRQATFENCVLHSNDLEIPSTCTRYLAQGGRYDPETNTWTELNLKGAPIGNRFAPVWTGKEILVFSSPDNPMVIDGTIIKGFRYSLDDDQWSMIRCGCSTYQYDPTFYMYPPILQAAWTGASVQLWSLHTGGVTYMP